jgi:hypothetical protein
MLVRCLYASRAAQPMNGAMLDEILEQSRRNNPALGITGLLCVSEDVFIQVLEGGREAVCELYNAIVRDARHQQVRLLVYEEIAQRRFNAWTMGQVDVARTNPALLLKYFTCARLDPFEAPGRATLALLEELVGTAGR